MTTATECQGCFSETLTCSPSPERPFLTWPHNESQTETPNYLQSLPSAPLPPWDPSAFHPGDQMMGALEMLVPSVIQGDGEEEVLEKQLFKL